MSLGDTPAELGGRQLGDELLTPTRIYALDCLAAAGAGGVHAFSHITGGGLAGNLARVLPPSGLQAVVERSTWAPQPIFNLIAGTGDVALADLELTFNLGVGMVAVVAPDAAQPTIDLLTVRGVPAWQLGEVQAAASADEPGPVVLMAGTYAGSAASWR